MYPSIRPCSSYCSYQDNISVISNTCECLPPTFRLGAGFITKEPENQRLVFFLERKDTLEATPAIQERCHA